MRRFRRSRPSGGSLASSPSVTSRGRLPLSIVALAMAAEPPSERSLPYYDRMPAKAALVAVCASNGAAIPTCKAYPTESLPTRPPLSDTGSPERSLERSLEMVLILAVADPQTAEEFLRLIEPQVAHLNVNGTRQSMARWFEAWSLVDPGHAVELAERQLATASKSAGWDIAASGILEGPFLILSLRESNGLSTLVSVRGLHLRMTDYPPVD